MIKQISDLCTTIARPALLGHKIVYLNVGK
uniref:Uncharacterized protein n=1 Tax=Lepeophtheirus salmonis TaxID=72036 RepID=A0A0K2VH49_LEPSM